MMMLRVCAARRGVRGHVHPHLLRDGRADREPEVRRRDHAVRERGVNGVRGPCRDNHHPVDRPHLRRAPEPVADHHVRGAAPLPLAAGARLRVRPGPGLHLRQLRAQGRLPPLPLRRRHRARRHHLHRPGLLHRVHHFIQPPLRRHRRRNRHPRRKSLV
jgi:hypothetical protein